MVKAVCTAAGHPGSGTLTHEALYMTELLEANQLQEGAPLPRVTEQFLKRKMELMELAKQTPASAS